MDTIREMAVVGPVATLLLISVGADFLQYDHIAALVFWYTLAYLGLVMFAAILLTVVSSMRAFWVE